MSEQDKIDIDIQEVSIAVFEGLKNMAAKDETISTDCFIAGTIFAACKIAFASGMPESALRICLDMAIADVKDAIAKANAAGGMAN